MYVMRISKIVSKLREKSKKYKMYEFSPQVIAIVSNVDIYQRIKTILKLGDMAPTYNHGT